MLKGGNPLTVGVGIIIEVIRKNNSDYDPEIGSGVESIPSSRDPIYLGTLLRLFASHVPDFMKLILSQGAPVTGPDGKIREYRRELKVAFGGIVEPLGFDRFKTCELMAELLHCSNMGLLNEKGGERYVKDRDSERERLKAERHQLRLEAGGLDGGVEEVVVDKAPLQVQNGGIELSDDGMNEEEFEDVTISGVLDDPRPDSREGMSGSLIMPEEDDIKKGDEDVFVDEPISPPTASSTEGLPDVAPIALESAELAQPASAEPSEAEGETAEKTDALTSQPQVEEKPQEEDREEKPASGEDPSVEPDETTNEDVTMGEAPPPPPKETRPVTESSSPTPVADLDPLKEAIESIESDAAAAPRAPSPPPSEDEDESLRKSGGSIIDELKLAASVPAPLSPKPPPVSQERMDAELPPLPKETEEATQVAVPAADEDEEENLMDLSGSSPDSTLNEGDVSVRSLGSFGSSFTEYQTLVEPDVDGNPVVGDFLKMMFVEHRVVPTILV